MEKTDITIRGSEIILNIIEKMVYELDDSSVFQYDEYPGCYSLFITIPNINHVLIIEEYLDVLRTTNQTMRYNIMIYENDKKYPSSIRINRNGKKVLTKQQIKYCAF